MISCMQNKPPQVEISARISRTDDKRGTITLNISSLWIEKKEKKKEKKEEKKIVLLFEDIEQTIKEFNFLIIYNVNGVIKNKGTLFIIRKKNNSFIELYSNQSFSEECLSNQNFKTSNSSVKIKDGDKLILSMDIACDENPKSETYTNKVKKQPNSEESLLSELEDAFRNLNMPSEVDNEMTEETIEGSTELQFSPLFDSNGFFVLI